jgi:cellulose synthase/poly-beta-1,6-N-acetylglucosamine synthase-like glycosyltransferase
MDYLPGIEDLRSFAIAVSWLVIGTGLVQSAINLAHLAIARRALGRIAVEARSETLWQRYSDVAPPIALLVPAYNEEKTIVESVYSLLALAYPHTEIIVVNDGSNDRTLDVLKETFKLEPVERSYDRIAPHADIQAIFGTPKLPRLLVLDKENGGKADAMNAAVNLARSPLFAAIDADSILDADSLIRAVRPFVNDPLMTVATGGTVRIANGCRIKSGRIVGVGLPHNILALFQIVEYLRAFLAARLALSAMNTLTLISGAFGVFRRSVVLDFGGYNTDTVGEDLELVIKIHRHLLDQGKDYAIAFVPDPVCWTEAPESLASLGDQRARWQRGALEVFFKYISMLGNQRYGRIGFLGFGHMLIVDVVGPVVEVLGYVLIPLFWGLGLLDFRYVLAFLGLTFSFGVLISVGSLALEEKELRRYADAKSIMILCFAAIAENFGYRQINNFWRLRGWVQFLRGKKDWGGMERKGFDPVL